MVQEKVICTREGTFVDFYFTIKTDFQYDFVIDGMITMSDNDYNVGKWNKTEDNYYQYFHIGKTISGDPNGTNSDYELWIFIKIVKKTSSELDDEILEEFNEACHKIELDWAFTEW